MLTVILRTMKSMCRRLLDPVNFKVHDHILGVACADIYQCWESCWEPAITQDGGMGWCDWGGSASGSMGRFGRFRAAWQVYGGWLVGLWEKVVHLGVGGVGGLKALSGSGG